MYPFFQRGWLFISSLGPPSLLLQALFPFWSQVSFGLLHALPHDLCSPSPGVCLTHIYTHMLHCKLGFVCGVELVVLSLWVWVTLLNITLFIPTHFSQNVTLKKNSGKAFWVMSLNVYLYCCLLISLQNRAAGEESAWLEKYNWATHFSHLLKTEKFDNTLIW